MSRRSFWRKVKDVSGQSLVELALLLPVLVVVLLGVIDVSRAIHAYNSITNISREGANLASRSGETYGPQQIMEVLADTAKPLDMANNGMMYITRAQTGATGWTFSQSAWQNRSAPPSAITDSASVAAILGPIDSRSGRSVCICEVFYKYDSLFLPGKLYAAYAPLLHSTAIF